MEFEREREREEQVKRGGEKVTERARERGGRETEKQKGRSYLVTKRL